MPPQVLRRPASPRRPLLGLLLSALLLAAPPPAAAQYCLPGAATTVDAVLVVCGSDPDRCADVQSKLRGTGAFATVDTFPAVSGTPTAAQLGGYHAVLAFSQYSYGFADAVLLGNRLAAYHDQGGGVVVLLDANQACCNLRGAYGSRDGGYALLDYASGGSTGPSDSLGDVLESQSPLMAGVASLAASYAWRSTAGVVAGRGAVVVARWRGGGREPLVVRGARGDRTLVELNFFPASSSGWPLGWTGDGAALMRNGLKFSRCMPCGKGTYAAAGEDGGGGA